MALVERGANERSHLPAFADDDIGISCHTICEWEDGALVGITIVEVC